jgi:PGM1 C-terminal domain
VIPKPPFAATLSLDEELATFERLKPTLAKLWGPLTAGVDEPVTSVVVPSLTLDPRELVKLEGASFYEERFLFLLIRLRNPRARVVYVTSQPVHPIILEYYLQMLAGVPSSHARARLTMLCAYDASPTSLTEKILERPRLIERIRHAIPDRERAYLTVFASTPHERKLAVLLGIPLNGCDPKQSSLGTKSGSRRIFREAGVPHPAGYEDLSSEDDVVRALVDLKAQRPGLRRAVVKLNDSFSGEGNALFDYPPASEPAAIAGHLPAMHFVAREEAYQPFVEKLRTMGGIVEECIEASPLHSPSAQLRTGPSGDVMQISTHDQILGGEEGQVFLGCRFPADPAYRCAIMDASARIGRVLADRGVVSRFGVDFLTWPDARGEWQLAALEINLRMGGTTHPFLALRFLSDGSLAEDGSFHSQTGKPLCYRATDNLKSPRYRGLLPEDLIDILTINRLHYSDRSESGVLFHLIGALSQYGKLGVTAIGADIEEVDGIYERTLSVLEAETRY